MVLNTGLMGPQNNRRPLLRELLTSISTQINRVEKRYFEACSQPIADSTNIIGYTPIGIFREEGLVLDERSLTARSQNVPYYNHIIYIVFFYVI